AVTVLDKGNSSWYKVSYTGSSGDTWTGYASAAYLTTGSANASDASATATTACALNLRSGAGTSYSVVKVLPKGAAVTVLDKSNSSWYKVSYTDASGKSWTGYASARYLQ
ncbi:MAG: SH3 domain-containing protein, partial [Clostridiales bacterium]|nr:SH3 domain-containing protein [Clostridiales bacterium]